MSFHVYIGTQARAAAGDAGAASTLRNMQANGIGGPLPNGGANKDGGVLAKARLPLIAYQVENIESGNR